MKNLEILREDEFIVEEAEISHTYFLEVYILYLISFSLLIISNELHLGIIGVVLLIRTVMTNYKFIQNKKAYSCVVTNQRLIIFKGQVLQEINPVSLKNVKTIFIKPFTLFHFLKVKDVGSLEIITKFDGRYVIEHIRNPYDFHKNIINDVVTAT